MESREQALDDYDSVEGLLSLSEPRKKPCYESDVFTPLNLENDTSTQSINSLKNEPQMHAKSFDCYLPQNTSEGKSTTAELLRKYDALHIEYTANGFTAKTEAIIKRLVFDDAIPNSFKSSFPIHRMIRYFIKLFLMNEFEIIIFANYIRKLGWEIEDKDVFEPYIAASRFEAVNPKCEDENIRLNLHLMCIACHTKSLTMEDSSLQPIFLAYINTRILPDFQSLFNDWVSKTDISISLSDFSEMNRTFLCSKSVVRIRPKKGTNYNDLVDRILEISPINISAQMKSASKLGKQQQQPLAAAKKSSFSSEEDETANESSCDQKTSMVSPKKKAQTINQKLELTFEGTNNAKKVSSNDLFLEQCRSFATHGQQEAAPSFGLIHPSITINSPFDGLDNLLKDNNSFLINCPLKDSYLSFFN